MAGTRTGAPAMVLLRGLFGVRLSYLPTALNIVQCLGWGIFELVTIAAAARTLAPALPRWGYILIAGVATALLALLTVARSPSDIYGAFIALPAGALCFAVLALRELDQSFANVYSTAASAQNLRPLWDRRVLAVAIAALTTAGALFLTIADYENFLILLGSVFVPMSAVLIVGFYLLARGRWDLSGRARTRWVMLLPWAAGFVTYQLINPGYVSWWASAWASLAHLIGFVPASWMSASICSFVVAAAATLVVGLPGALARSGGTPGGGGTPGDGELAPRRERRVSSGVTA
jgi:NCS1 family nucleobase:cation symporter-1